MKPKLHWTAIVAPYLVAISTFIDALLVAEHSHVPVVTVVDGAFDSVIVWALVFTVIRGSYWRGWRDRGHGE